MLTDRLYWCDLRRVESCAMDGTDRQVMLREYEFGHPASVLIYDQKLVVTFVGSNDLVTISKVAKGTPDKMSLGKFHCSLNRLTLSLVDCR